MLSKMLVYLVLFLPCLLSSPALFFCCIPPLTHHSSSHLPPLPPVSLSRFLCAHISVFPTCLTPCFSFSPCLFLSSPTLSSSFLKLFLVLGSVAVMILLSTLDIDLALFLISLFLQFFLFTSFPPSVLSYT